MNTRKSTARKKAGQTRESHATSTLKIRVKFHFIGIYVVLISKHCNSLKAEVKHVETKET